MIPPVVDAAWLAESPDVVLADVRWYLDGRSGRVAYDQRHLPGAVFVDLDEWLAAPPSSAQGRHPLPDPAVFARGMGVLGIGDSTVVVAYDDAGGTVAARLVWMLRVTGHDAALLDGGLTAWTGALSRTHAEPVPASFTPAPWPIDRVVDLADLGAAGHLVDARQGERFRGEVEPVDARRGHIPGALSLPSNDNLEPDGRFLPVAVLQDKLAALGIAPCDDVVSYCGSGVTACHNLLALELAGFGAGRLYAGSWSQYAATDLPAATGKAFTVRLVRHPPMVGRVDPFRPEEFSMADQISSTQVTNFADLGKEMWAYLTGRGAVINYEFVDMTVEVPRETGPASPRATWKLNGTLRITTSENAAT